MGTREESGMRGSRAISSGAPADGAPYLRKFGNPSISTILVVMGLSVHTYVRAPSPMPREIRE